MKSVDHKCINCNAVLKYNPKGKNWKCEYCGSTFNKNDLTKNEEKYKEAKVKEDVKKFLPSDYDTSLVSYKYEGKETLSYLDKVGNKIGKISYYYNDMNKLCQKLNQHIDLQQNYF